MKNNIILCDFRRTERRKRMEEIPIEIQALAYEQEIDLTNLIESNKFFMQKKPLQLQNEYADLCEEEQLWGECKYWK